MPNRIDQKFKELKKKKKKAFIAYITAGDPNLKTTEELVLAFERSGADLVELGVPFSDPLADGPTIQASYERALKQRVNLEKIVALVNRLRQKTAVPIALMTSFNPVFHYGEKKFAVQARKSGADGVIIPDLPPEEARELIRAARANTLATVFFLSPTTIKSRLKRIDQSSTGFIYYVSLTGVTGARKKLSNDFNPHIRALRRSVSKPVCVGFGISTPEQVKQAAQVADGVIVGSAIVNEVFKNKGKRDLVRRTAKFVARLAAPLRK